MYKNDNVLEFPVPDYPHDVRDDTVNHMSLHLMIEISQIPALFHFGLYSKTVSSIFQKTTARARVDFLQLEASLPVPR